MTLVEALTTNEAITKPRDESDYEIVESDMEESVTSEESIQSATQRTTRSVRAVKKPRKM